MYMMLLIQSWAGSWDTSLVQLPVHVHVGSYMYAVHVHTTVQRLS